MEWRRPKLIPRLPLYCSCVQELYVNHQQPGTAAHKSPSQDPCVLDELLNIASSERQAPVITDEVAPWQQLGVTKDVINPVEITAAGFFPPIAFFCPGGAEAAFREYFMVLASSFTPCCHGITSPGSWEVPELAAKAGPPTDPRSAEPFAGS